MYGMRMGQMGGMAVRSMSRTTLQYQGHRLIAAYLDDQRALLSRRSSGSRTSSSNGGTTQLLGALRWPVGENQWTLLAVSQRQEQCEQQEWLARMGWDNVKDH